LYGIKHQFRVIYRYYIFSTVKMFRMAERNLITKCQNAQPSIYWPATATTAHLITPFLHLCMNNYLWYSSQLGKNLSNFLSCWRRLQYFPCNWSRRHDNQHNDTQHNDIHHNDIHHNAIHHNDIQHEAIQLLSMTTLACKIPN